MFLIWTRILIACGGLSWCAICETTFFDISICICMTCWRFSRLYQRKVYGWCIFNVTGKQTGLLVKNISENFGMWSSLLSFMLKRIVGDELFSLLIKFKLYCYFTKRGCHALIFFLPPFSFNNSSVYSLFFLLILICFLPAAPNVLRWLVVTGVSEQVTGEHLLLPHANVVCRHLSGDATANPHHTLVLHV